MHTGLNATASRLREPRESDHEELAALRLDTALQHKLMAYPTGRGSEDIDSWIARRTDEPGGAFMVVVDDRDQCVGYVQIFSVHRLGCYGYFGIALADAARGRGWGRGALEDLTEHARKYLGLYKLLLEVRADNAAAIRLYETAGFRTVGVLERHYDDGHSRHDAIIMERILKDAG